MTADQALKELLDGNVDNYLNHLIGSKRTPEALDYINSKILKNQNQAALYQRLAEVYRLSGRKEDAISQLEIASEIYLQANNRSAAMGTIKAILALNPVNASSYQKMLLELQTG